MPRPKKWRRIGHMPSVLAFEPKDSGENQGQNTLKVEELEAIRLKDLLGLDQSECAREMEVSRPTFQRILLTGRGKVADSLVHGRAIQIDGGHYTQQICPIRCLDCGKEWTESLENIPQNNNDDFNCPKCHSAKLSCCSGDHSEQGEACRRRCRKLGAANQPEQS